ncbi:hypothetical protein ACFSTE_16170 [Aquimarina hainanensis]|uniref:Tetratricopeptide repeat protein n=1 Tax=Aquimarina hainanensis TaxID=1578017 RepID=A0ABW5NAV6_9FLAO|nr:hypothetical protein [Aquimarina sp. TRL1]QKX07113.1 hypothetical protein HN014_20070 [Aquimarina sp. TRL1]
MKYILLLVLAVSASFTSEITAQSSYEKGMTKAFSLWKENKADEAANLFERIGRAEQDNWIPYYYVAQINILTTFGLKEATEIESRLKKAQNFINDAKTFSKDNAEIHIMEALLNTAWVAYKPSVFGMTHSTKVEQSYQAAKQLEPENPRAMLYHAEWKMGAARFFGKDPKTFCSEVEKAILYFDKEQKKEIPFYPKWGKDQIKRVQRNCNS